MTPTYAPSQHVREQIDAVYSICALHGNQMERHKEIGAMAKRLAHFMAEHVPESRELSLALTHLETATMFATAGIIRNEVET